MKFGPCDYYCLLVDCIQICSGRFINSSSCSWQVSLAFSAIKDRKAIGKVMIILDDKRNVRSNL